MRRLLICTVTAAVAFLALSAMPASGLTPVPVSATILFDKDSAELTDVWRRVLEGVPSFIHYAGKGCLNVRISGHVDRAEAKAGRAGRLDLKRATTVRDHLRAVPILEGYLFDVFAYADDRPDVPDAPDDEPKNRRVVVNWECAKAQ